MGISRLSHFILSASLFFTLQLCPIFASKKLHVVYLGAHSHDRTSTAVDYDKVTDSHLEFLGSFLESKETAKSSIVYSYTKSINGFAAALDEEQANQISKHPKVISVFLNKRKQLHTTRSWTNLGLERNGRIPKQSLMYRARFGADVIIGHLDTGVWPESESFNDRGIGPVPSRWKGICQTNTTTPIKCNRKLIGGRLFSQAYEFDVGEPTESSQTLRDVEGHGTHTLSTSGGRIVPASVFGLGKGLAKGGSPSARVVAYKVCFELGCSDGDILAAFDAAIDDGLDIISVSLGAQIPIPYLIDPIAIGSLHAVSSGIAVICSAGNEGPAPGSVTNVAPWFISVGASTIDRDFRSVAILGNKKRYNGISISDRSLPKKNYPLINSADAAATDWLPDEAQFCPLDSLDPEKVKDKIVFCLRGNNIARVEKGDAVLRAGGAGMILGNDPVSGNDLTADAHLVPATQITASDALDVLSYINSTKSPVAYIAASVTELNIKPAPVIAAFSSRGPNQVTPEILKPDIIAPGVNIVAAFSESVSPTNLIDDKRRVPFFVESGTSMSCPHVTGIVGLLKSLHPDWSPSAIYSAIITSARTRDDNAETILDESFNPGTPFSYGAGHVRPNRAMDPGLVYDLTIKDYLDFLCSQNYSSTKLALLNYDDKPYPCPKNISALDLNYPSISVPSLIAPTTITRRVKNVGAPGTYKVRLHTPRGLSISVKPDTLSFKEKGEEKVFKVELAPAKNGSLGGDYVFGKIVWFDGKHYVRTPIAVKGV